MTWRGFQREAGHYTYTQQLINLKFTLQFDIVGELVSTLQLCTNGKIGYWIISKGFLSKNKHRNSYRLHSPNQGSFGEIMTISTLTTSITTNHTKPACVLLENSFPRIRGHIFQGLPIIAVRW